MFGKEFRPLTFGDVLGLSTTKKILQGYLKTGEYATAYLFVGAYSSGKTTLGRLFARSILCENRAEDMSPCNACPSCKSFLEDRHPGYLEIDAATNSGKERIQEIKESLQYESVANKKIILFDEAHGISKDGKDGLLKPLEANNPNVIFIFCTTELEKMPSTIRSRCAEFHLPEPSESLMIQKLSNICKAKNIEYDINALSLIVRATGRHYRDAENKLQQTSMLGPITLENVSQVVSLYDQEIVEMLLALPKDVSEAMLLAEQLTAKMDVRSIYHSVLRILNDAIKVGSGLLTASDQYNTMMKTLKVQYDKVLFEVLDFILSKNRLSDITFFESDLLIIHHKFVKGGFNLKGFTAPQEEEQAPKREINRDAREIVGNKNLPPWQQSDLIRKFKAERTKKESDEKVPEKVSEKWGPETLSNQPAQPKKTKLSPKEFESIVGGTSIEEEKF